MISSAVSLSWFPPMGCPAENRVPADATGVPAQKIGDCEGSDEENDLARMARLVRSNDRLMLELRSIRRRVESARAYLGEPGCRVRLGAAYLERLMDRRSAVLACLRANRIEAQGLLNSLGY